MIDLLIVGGGPAGLATALTAARAGLSVTVLEQRDGVIDKACGEGLMPGAVAALAALGVDPPGHPYTGIRYVDRRGSAVAPFRRGIGRGVRRLALHSALRDAVHTAGVPIIQQKVDAIEQDDRSVTVGGRTARYLVGADGLHSPIRRQLGLEVADTGPHRFGIRRHFTMAPWTDLVEVHWSAHAEAYVTPVAPDLVGVAILSAVQGGFEDQLAAFPELAVRLPAPVNRARGAGPLRQRVSSRVAGRVLLVGDAAGYVDALTGEGISVSLGSAVALVRCVLDDEPARYERDWLRVSRRYRWITESLLWARRRPMLARSIVPAARLLPPVFSAAVGQLAR